LAELVLEAFDKLDARVTLAALARGCAADEVLLEADEAARLLALGWFEASGSGRVRLRPAHRAQRARLAERAGRAAALVRAWQDPPGDALARLLGRAASLADEGLFFEAHELLEPAWFRAEEPLRTALQGLIQVAVAFHHLDHGNRDGARSLLAEGGAKLAAAAGALPLETAGWLGELRAAEADLAAGGAVTARPAWPRPGGSARPAAGRPAAG
jgi:hypothetical protein